ncbi:MAG TPA: hypothetical protein VFV53_03030 [Candidatus Limnocylindrales bacterium]|nr:hypothetical protein [Candidatus Limnocylindrales bacterium]
MSTSRDRRPAFVVVLVLTGCASPVPDQSPSGLCEAAPAALVTAVSEGLVAGTSLTGARMVRDPEREDFWLVAAELDGPGITGEGEIGVWATDLPDDPTMIWSVDAFALEFSEWPRIPDPSLSEREFARACL